MAKRRVGVEYSPSMLEPVRPGAVSPDRALCSPTFSHFVIVNKTSLFLSLPPPLTPHPPTNIPRALPLCYQSSKTTRKGPAPTPLPVDTCGWLRIFKPHAPASIDN
jgi:hypothetical protein